MKTIEAVYEAGVFRPLAALDAPEGTVVVVNIPDDVSSDLISDADKAADMAAMRYLISPPLEASLPEADSIMSTPDPRTDWEIVQEIISKPLQNQEPFSGEDHDEVLYGWKKSS